MATEPKTVRVRINKPIPPHSVGDEVSVAVDKEGTPLEQGWRRRFHDSERDECVTILSDKKTAAKPAKGDE